MQNHLIFYSLKLLALVTTECNILLGSPAKEPVGSWFVVDMFKYLSLFFCPSHHSVSSPSTLQAITVEQLAGVAASGDVLPSPQ